MIIKSFLTFVAILAVSYGFIEFVVYLFQNKCYPSLGTTVKVMLSVLLGLTLFAGIVLSS